MDSIEQVKQEVLNLLPPVLTIRDMLMGNLEKNPGAEKIEYWIDIRDSMQKQQAASATASAAAPANPQPAASAGANAVAPTATGGGFETKPSDDGNSVIITKYTGSDTTLEIPSQINGKPVTGIGERAFSGIDITGVTIPDGVTFIGEKAFWRREGLTGVIIPDSVKSIGEDAFGSLRYDQQ